MKKQLLLFVMTLLTITANADDNGKCGDNVYYSYNSATHTLTISGEGAMWGYGYEWGDYDNTPWHSYLSDIHSVIIEYGVTRIGQSAFENCTNLTSVTIPNSVTDLGSDTASRQGGPFKGCTGLTSITIPNSVTYIGQWAFQGCTGLTSITIPNGVTHIYHQTFADCTRLTSINIPNSVTYITSSAFQNSGWYNNQADGILYLNKLLIGFKGDKPIGSLIIADGTLRIINDAFSNCSGLRTVTIPSSVTSIGLRAFNGCSGLATVLSEIEDPIEIDTHAFEGIPSDAKLIIPQGTKAKYQTTEGWNRFTNIVEVDGKCGANAYFSYNSATHTLTISGKGEIFNNFSLPSCDVDHVIIESGIYSIGEHFLEDQPDPHLPSITIPSSLTSIDDDSFWFSTVYITDLEAWFNIDFHHNAAKAGSLFLNGEEIKDLVIPNTVKSIRGEGSATWDGLTSVTIPNSVTSISSEAFQNCYNLTSIKVEDGNPYYDSRNNCNAIIDSNNQLIVGCKNTVIPNSVTSIGHCAFWGCTGLTSITIPNNVTSIGHYAFSNCSGLTSVNIPDKVTSIGDNAFFNCYSLVYISLPSKLTSIDGYAFSYCNSLTDIYCKATNVPNVSNHCFSNPGNIILYVPSESIDAYKSTEPWKNFKSIVSLDNSDTQAGQKCSKPTISLVNGKYVFSCDTPDVSYRWSFSTPNGNNGSGNSVSPPFKLNVFATKSGYQNSDVATYVFPSLVGDVNQDGIVTIADAVSIVNIILEGHE